MTINVRITVLQCFKSLHKARKKVFKGDDRALTESRNRINTEFKKNKHIQNHQAILELIEYAKAIEKEVRTCVIQAKEVKSGVYQAQILDETAKLDNVLFKDEHVKQQ
ncbi:complex III assembly factor LYRM7 [Cylas formicarius]|uniref:complex III assembly factor LYRM7 n=1 Tax=Cylas formicarius TaxID=197179 RepID=UPI002958D8EE|nr:complex III assembly factor LYRM7 [Cylas formicarius]